MTHFYVLFNSSKKQTVSCILANSSFFHLGYTPLIGWIATFSWKINSLAANIISTHVKITFLAPGSTDR